MLHLHSKILLFSRVHNFHNLLPRAHYFSRNNEREIIDREIIDSLF